MNDIFLSVNMHNSNIYHKLSKNPFAILSEEIHFN